MASTIQVELLETGKIIPVIDQTYSLNEIVNAFRYVEDIHARGKVVIEIQRGWSTMTKCSLMALYPSQHL